VLLELKPTLVEFALLPEIPTEQTVDPLLAIVLGLQLNPLNWTAWAETVKEMDAVWICPFSVAVTVALSFAVKVPVLARKLAVVDPAGIVKLGGKLRALLSLEIAILIVPVAALFKETVQVALALLPSEVGEQEREESCGGALALKVKICEPPFRAAVKTAV
jgi:hypothetical protein